MQRTKSDARRWKTRYEFLDSRHGAVDTIPGAETEQSFEQNFTPSNTTAHTRL